MDAVHDLFITRKDDVAVFAHDLHNQPHRTFHADLVTRGDVDVHDALQTDLADRRDPAAGDVFAQQHAEIRRFIGIRLLRGCNVYAALRAVCREHETLFPLHGMQQKNDLIPFGLMDFFNFTAAQDLKFSDQCIECNAVQRHAKSP